MFTNPTIVVLVAARDELVRLVDPDLVRLELELLALLASATTLTLSSTEPRSCLRSTLPSSALFLTGLSSRYLPTTLAFSRKAQALTAPALRLSRRFCPSGRLNVEADPSGPVGLGRAGAVRVVGVC